MSTMQLLIRNLVYHWRGNSAVFLGITLGAAVLAGALFVGDSLRGSMKALTLDQLGWVEEALLPGRFFRAALADDVSAERKAALLLMQGSASRRAGADDSLRVGKVTVLGVDASFWPGPLSREEADFWASDEREVLLNATLAKALGAKVGDRVTLNLQRVDRAPPETALAHRDPEQVIQRLDLKVRAILPDEGMNRFSLKPTPEPVRNAFVPIRTLQKRLDLPGLANALFVAQPKSTLQADLQKALTLEDWGLTIRTPKERAEAFVKLLDPRNDDGKLKKFRWEKHVPDALAQAAAANKNILTLGQIDKYYEAHRDYSILTSRRTILEPQVIQAIQRLGNGAFPPYANPIVIALADSISDGKAEIPYSIVAGVKPDRMLAGPLADDEIVLVEAPDCPLRARIGDRVTVTWFASTESNDLKKESHTFKVTSRPKLKGKFDDPDLTPEYPGITDKLDIGNWENPPFPYNPKRARTIENYWERYRTTPRAYVNLDIAKKLWGTRFGDITTIQLMPATPATFAKDLLAELKPASAGFVFQPVRAQAVNASAGATDFGMLFIAFSFFLIVSALLLVGLLVRLNIDRRAAEMGLLLATGWSHGQVRRLLLAEGTLLALVGGLVGLGGALLYGRLMLRLLAANWPGGESLNFLRLHAEPLSYAIGLVASFLVSVLTLIWATRVLGKLTPRSLLSGETTAAPSSSSARLGWSWWLVPIGVVGAIALGAAAPFFPSHEAQAGSFFTSGALLLTACIAAAWNGLKRTGGVSSPQPTIARLGMRNAGRHLARSVLTIGLLAAASFLIVAVESFHKSADQNFLDKSSGSGGFAFYADGSVPVREDLNKPKVREEHGLDAPELTKVEFYPFRVQPGDDASCLNLYKPLKPRVMGVSPELIQRGGFHFAASMAKSEAEKANPWLLLASRDDAAVPAILDANTAQWILKVELGDTLDVNNEEGMPVKLRVVALLQESIFQSEVLVSERAFLNLFPRQTGFSFYLIDAGTTEPARLKTIEKQLQKGMDDFSMDVSTTASRLEGYLAVENMYLSTFQALGGLGLLLGAVGLAIVLLRGVWERRAELALLQALGFRSGQLAWLVLVENAFLLLLGLAAGTVSALLAVAPHLIGAGAQVLWLRIGVLLAGVLAVGLLAAALAVWSAARTPVLTALRRE